MFLNNPQAAHGTLRGESDDAWQRTVTVDAALSEKSRALAEESKALVVLRRECARQAEAAEALAEGLRETRARQAEHDEAMAEEMAVLAQARGRRAHYARHAPPCSRPSPCPAAMPTR